MQVKVARVPTLMVKPVSIRLYNDSRVLYHDMTMLQCIFFMMMTMQCDEIMHSYNSNYSCVDEIHNVDSPTVTIMMQAVRKTNN